MSYDQAVPNYEAQLEIHAPIPKWKGEESVQESTCKWNSLSKEICFLMFSMSISAKQHKRISLLCAFATGNLKTITMAGGPAGDLGHN